jgi:hypothetical protein
MFFKKNNPIDYRRYPRIPLSTRIHYTHQGYQQWNDALVRSISTHGMGIYTDKRIQKGDRLVIALSLLTDERESLHESILGEVTWAGTGEEKKRYTAGIYFGEIEEKHPKLYAYLKRLEAAVTAIP